MADSKIYLNVPFAQKDEAKLLGARWDAVNKKWYSPAGMDITLFARWQTESSAVKMPTTSTPRSKTSSSKISSSFRETTSGIKTYATVKDFVAYNGDEPPWN
ncbi:MAG: DUF5710 domain-containing protein [Methylobacter sp.]|jgi:hypothetical protein